MAVRKSSQPPLIWTKYAYGGEVANYKRGLIIRQRGKYTVVISYLCKLFKPKNLKDAKSIIDRQMIVIEKEEKRRAKMREQYKPLIIKIK